MAKLNEITLEQAFDKGLDNIKVDFVGQTVTVKSIEPCRGKKRAFSVSFHEIEGVPKPNDPYLLGFDHEVVDAARSSIEVKTEKPAKTEKK